MIFLPLQLQMVIHFSGGQMQLQVLTDHVAFANRSLEVAFANRSLVVAFAIRSLEDVVLAEENATFLRGLQRGSDEMAGGLAKK